MALSTANLADTGSGVSGTSGRRIVSRVLPAVLRLGLAVVVTAVVTVGVEPQSAAAASFDRRITNEYQLKCLGNEFGITPTVRVTQPYVFGRTASWETIRWMPYLQRWVPGQGWQHVLRSTKWMNFLANWNGTEISQYTNRPHIFPFSNLTRGYYYRVIHVIQWTSNGELGTMPSNYFQASGACFL